MRTFQKLMYSPRMAYRGLKGILLVFWFPLLLAAAVGFTVAVLGGCLTKVIEPTDVVEPEDLADIAESYCDARPDFPCGHVYECAAVADTPSGFVETCVLDDIPLEWAEVYYGAECKPTTRHVGLCWYCCGAGCGPGCNAYSGCYCEGPPPGPDIPEHWREYFPYTPVPEWLPVNRAEEHEDLLLP